MNNQQQLHSDEAPPENNLIHLEQESHAIGKAKDINAKISLLEASLGELQAELEVINRSVDEGLERLSDSDLDLTSKVSETYKRLGEIDNTYKSLSTISENIDNEVRKLTSEIEDVATQSAADLENHNTQFNEQHQQLVERVNELVRHSQETNAQLTLSASWWLKSIRWRIAPGSVPRISRKNWKAARHEFFSCKRLMMRWKGVQLRSR